MIHDQSAQTQDNKKRETFFSAIYIGSLFVLVGLIYYLNLSVKIIEQIVNFFTTLTLAMVPDTGIYLPAPLNPAAHSQLYGLAFQFALGIGAIEIIVLVLRVLMNSPINRKAETVGNIVFSFGSSYLIFAYLNTLTTINQWFVFWAGIIMIFGLSLVARAFVLLAKRWI